MGNTDNEAVEAARKLGILGGSFLTSFVEGWNAARSKKPIIENVPTAEEFFNRYGGYTREEMLEDSIRFAKAHVEAALKAAAENSSMDEPNPWRGKDYWSVDRESILTAYPPENIR